MGNSISTTSIGIVDEIRKLLGRFHNNTQISVALVKDNTTTFCGATKQGGDISQIDNFDSVFEIGSISKVFTSTILADCALKGIVQLDQPIQDFLDFRLKHDAHITFKQLANHTAGLSRIPSDLFKELALRELRFKPNTNPYQHYSNERLILYLREKLKTLKPGKYKYSNLGVGLLGFVLERATGKSYEHLLQKTVFESLSMYASTSERKKVVKKLVNGLDKRGRCVSNWDLASLAGAGAVLSTTHDLAKFIQANFDQDNRALALTREATVDMGGKQSVGLGWHISREKSGDIWHMHDGGTGGYRSAMTVDVKNRTGVAVLSNVSGLHLLKGNLITILATRLMYI